MYEGILNRERNLQTRIDKRKKFSFTGVPSKKNTIKEDGALKSAGTAPQSKGALDVLGVN